jgi:hypothetical protein
MVDPQPAFRLTPSAIARYFFLDCDRFLRFWAAPETERQAAGIPDQEFDHSPLMQAVLESGIAWEAEVVGQIIKGRVSMAPGAGPLTERRFTAPATLERLRAEPAGRFIYQATLRPPQRFYDTYGLDPNLAFFGDCHPDLIEVKEDPEGGRLLRVIDVKWGDSLQVAHRVQVLLYALALDAILQEAGIRDAKVDSQSGAVWLGKQPEPEPFDTRSLQPHLAQFLREVLPRLLARPAAEAAWHFSYNSERCSYCDHCRAEMRATDDISQLTATRNSSPPGCWRR